ncbi:MAG: 2OG-Fe(II) oxygenase, partial [Pseudobdellovibrio sp.]
MLNSIHLDQYFEKLAENSWVVLPFDKDLSKKLLQSAQDKTPLFKAAGLARHDQPDTQIRSDRIYWLESKSGELNETDHLILRQLEDLKNNLKNFFRTSLNEFECHYSVYGQGQHYDRHSDAPFDNNKRVFSFVIYLNENWREENGGQIIGYNKDKILF